MDNRQNCLVCENRCGCSSQPTDAPRCSEYHPEDEIVNGYCQACWENAGFKLCQRCDSQWAETYFSHGEFPVHKEWVCAGCESDAQENYTALYWD